ncbi:MAG TPA: flagellar basal body-associated FliL family protein [Acidobacteriaceae bacterium]
MAASAETSGSITSGSAVGKRKNASRAWVIIGALLLIGANVGFWFYRTKVQEGAIPITAAAQASAQPQSESVPLEPFVVNLAAGESYLKVAMTLAVRSRTTPKSRNTPHEVLESAVVRDTILNTLSAQDAGTLLTVQGKEALKKALKSALNAKDPSSGVKDIYFTEFLVER